MFVRSKSRFLKKVSGVHNSRFLTGGQIIYNQLKNNQVKDTFIYSGGAIMPLVDCFYQGSINYYVNTHEQSAGHAATAYARSSGNTGVCIVS